MIKDLIKQLLNKKDLTSLQMQQVMREILSGAVDTADIIAFLTSLNEKGETVAELTAAVNVMLKYVDYPMEFKNLMDRLISREREQYGIRGGTINTVEGEIIS